MTTSAKFNNPRKLQEGSDIKILHGKDQLVYMPSKWTVKAFNKEGQLCNLRCGVQVDATGLEVATNVLQLIRSNPERAFEPSYGYLIPINPETGKPELSDVLFWHINNLAACEELEAKLWKLRHDRLRQEREGEG